MHMKTGLRYRVVIKQPEWKYSRFAVMNYLGTKRMGGEMDRNPLVLCFDARPLAGTQEVPLAWIEDVRLVAKTSPISLWKRAPIQETEGTKIDL